jgi:hypothetical protein
MKIKIRDIVESLLVEEEKEEEKKEEKRKKKRKKSRNHRHLKNQNLELKPLRALVAFQQVFRKLEL